jgi:hypothetical protein
MSLTKVTTQLLEGVLPASGGAMTGAITTNSTFDGRDVATDGVKLDGIAVGANNYSLPANIGTQSVVTTAPTSASGFANGHVWYVVS